MASIPRLFVSQDLRPNFALEITDRDHHYLANVMRIAVGDGVMLINGRDGEFSATVEHLGKRSLMLRIGTPTRAFFAQPFLSLAFAPIQKMENVLKSATELGVTQFTTLITEYTNKNLVKFQKLEGNIKEAVEQSERMDFPKINAGVKLQKFLDSLAKDDCVLFCEERRRDNSMREVLDRVPPDKKIHIVVGPEGGFSPPEKDLMNSHPQVHSVSLGDTILRAETASIAAVAAVKIFRNNRG